MTAALARLRSVREALTFDPRRGLRLGAGEPWLEVVDALEPLGQRVADALSRVAATGAGAEGTSGWLRRQLVARGTTWTCFEPGFVVVRHGEGGSFVSDGATRLWVTGEGALRPSAAPARSPVEVRLPCGRPHLHPGRFTLVSRAGRPKPGPAVELVVGLTAEGVLELADALVLDRVPQRTRFVAELRDEEEALPATDALQLRVGRGDARRLTYWLRGLSGRHPGWFTREVHPLVVPLGRGLGSGAAPAEGEAAPAAGVSRPGFLASRAATLAEALVRSAVSGAAVDEVVAEALGRAQARRPARSSGP